MSCVFVPTITQEGQISLSPSYIRSGQNVVVFVPQEAQVRGYNTMGLPVFTADIPAGESTLPLSVERGMYILVVSSPDGDKPFRVIVE